MKITEGFKTAIWIIVTIAAYKLWGYWIVVFILLFHIINGIDENFRQKRRRNISNKNGVMRKQASSQTTLKEYQIPQNHPQMTGPEEVIYNGKIIKIPGPTIIEQPSMVHLMESLR